MTVVGALFSLTFAKHQRRDETCQCNRGGFCGAAATLDLDMEGGSHEDEGIPRDPAGTRSG